MVCRCTQVLLTSFTFCFLTLWTYSFYPENEFRYYSWSQICSWLWIIFNFHFLMEGVSDLPLRGTCSSLTERVKHVLSGPLQCTQDLDVSVSLCPGPDLSSKYWIGNICLARIKLQEKCINSAQKPCWLILIRLKKFWTLIARKTTHQNGGHANKCPNGTCLSISKVESRCIGN